MAPRTLINTSTLQLEENYDDTVKYAILSHTWGPTAEEVTFQDMGNDTIRRAKAGWSKILECCIRAQNSGIKYAWVDSCCIDKKSSAELSEAINSMYQYYENAAVCYAYLADVEGGEESSLAGSKWFTRGWTLQELIAPQHMIFYDQAWHPMGTKASLRTELSRITRIDPEVLDSGKVISWRKWVCVAQRMSWVSNRQTTRGEDIAYCLLGIFDVNMPLLYGEGPNKAFLRLQGEIIKTSDDQSIFAWKSTSNLPSGLLAESPVAFEHCADVGRAFSIWQAAAPFSITNIGLSITLSITPCTLDTYIATLECSSRRKRGSLGIYLRRLYSENQYIRVSVLGESLVEGSRAMLSSRARAVAVMVPQGIPRMVFNGDISLERIFGFKIGGDVFCTKDRTGLVAIAPERQMSVLHASMATYWDSVERTAYVLNCSETQGKVAEFNVTSKDGSHPFERVMVGFDFDFNPVCIIAESTAVNFNWIPGPSTYTEFDGSPEEKDCMKKALEDRLPDDVLGWNEIHPTRIVANNSFRKGLWALKGNRLFGVHGLIPVSVQVSPTRKEEVLYEVRSGKVGNSSGMEVWELNISRKKSSYTPSH